MDKIIISLILLNLIISYLFLIGRIGSFFLLDQKKKLDLSYHILYILFSIVLLIIGIILTAFKVFRCLVCE